MTSCWNSRQTDRQTYSRVCITRYNFYIFLYDMNIFYSHKSSKAKANTNKQSFGGSQNKWTIYKYWRNSRANHRNTLYLRYLAIDKSIQKDVNSTLWTLYKSSMTDHQPNIAVFRTSLYSFVQFVSSCFKSTSRRCKLVFIANVVAKNNMPYNYLREISI